MKAMAILLATLGAVTIAAVGVSASAGGQPARWSYDVVGSYPQDAAAFTQGLCYDGETLFLGTGQYGASSVRRVDLESGRSALRRHLDPRLFGEGVAVHGNTLYQLTWKAGLVLTYDAETLRPGKPLRYRGEGWGLTSNGKVLIMSDGSATLTGRDPDSFDVVWRLPVTLAGRPVASLNELEFINGRIFANVWQRDEIVVIDPASGAAEAVIDCADLVAETRRRTRWAGVLNGIAYDRRRDLVLVTGKNWDRIYALRLGD